MEPNPINPRIRRAALAGALGIPVLFALAGTSGAATLSSPPPEGRLGGLLPFEAGAVRGWCWSGAWLFPVGSPYVLGETDDDSEPGYALNRGVKRTRAGTISHQGVDLCNHHPGGEVHAAAHGLVIHTGRDKGYGLCVVVAHRPDDGGPLLYSVYAHLARGSVLVKSGDMVAAHQTIGRVGRTGRATTDHLHFEIREARDPWARWENARVIEPIGFIAEHAPSRSDSSSLSSVLEWAECAALIGRDERSGVVLTRARWWRMLARAARHDLEHPPEELAALRDDLIAAGVLPEGAPRRDGEIGWKELDQDLERLGSAGLRLPAFVRAGRLPVGTGETSAQDRASHRRGDPTIADACLSLAQLSAPLAATSGD